MANSINYTYVYYNVVDYTGNSVLSSFTLGNTPLTFIPDFSTSPILSGAQSISNKLCHWDFGDGSTSDTISPTHNYQWPGQYNVTLTIFDATGNAYDSTYQSIITVYDYISTQIAFQDYNSFVYDIPAGRLIDPFVLNTNFSWQNYQALTATGVTINLYASGAHGDYNYVADTLKDKWEHLRSLSRFYTLSSVGSTPDYLEIDSIQPSLTAVYVNIQNNLIKQCKATDSGATLAGAIGNCQFWYTDDRPANLTTESSPVILFATLDNSKLEDAFTQRTNAYEYISYPPYGYQNIEPAVYASIKTRFNPANRLSITTTGIDGEGALSATNFSIPYISWQNTEIPYVVKFKDSFNYTTKNYPPLSSSQITGTPPQSAYDLQVGVVSVSGNNYTSLGQVTFYQDFPQQAPQSLGAFYKGYFIPQQSSLNCALTAAVTVVEPAYYQKDALVGWIAIPQYNSAFRILRQTQINGFTGDTTVSFTNNSNPLFSLGNNQNVYAMCVATSGSGSGNDYQTWFADPVNDVIVKYDLYGNPLPVYVDGNNVTQYSFTLSAMPVLTNNLITYNNDFRTSSTLGDGVSSHAAPNGIAMDSNSDIWVTLLDSGSAIKINTSRGVVTTVAAPAGIFNYAYTLSSYYNVLSGFAGENLLMPTSLDTDIQNNLWVAYDHPAYSALVKYQGVGNFTTIATTLTSVLFPTGISPEEICIDRNQYIWVTATNHNINTALSSTNGNGILYKFDTNGNLLSTITGFSTLGNLTVDGNQNAWVTQDAETLVKVDGLLGTKSYYLAGKGNNKTEYINSIGGITCDTANHIWVINNFDKNLYIIDANTPATTPPFLNPLYTIPLTYPTTGLSAVNTYSDGLQEFQAIGDWNGYKWLNKYAAPVSTIRTITGSSSLFNIYPSSGQYNISKINEGWDASGYYSSLRYQESLLDKDVFFKQFLGVILGDLNAQPYELGKTVYEKIANFVDNNSDIDKVNISELISFCEELSIDFAQYNYVLPPQIRRLMDLLSIKQSILWGNSNKYTLNFNPQGTMFHNNTYGINLSSAIDPLTGTFISGTPIIAQEVFSGNYILVNTNFISGSGTVIPLSAYDPSWGWGLVVPNGSTGTAVSNYYKFYNFNPQFDGTYYDNIINWNNPLTTLTPTNSSYSNWSGDNGIIQNMLSYEMTKGFKLFTSAAKITYNS